MGVPVYLTNELVDDMGRLHVGIAGEQERLAVYMCMLIGMRGYTYFIYVTYVGLFEAKAVNGGSSTIEAAGEN